MKNKRTVPLMSPRASKAERGFSLITTALCMTVTIGFIGLTLDVGRLYMVKAELQSFVDTAAFLAALELDGTTAGIDRARTAGQSGPQWDSKPNRWNFGTQNVTGVQVSFSNTADSGYSATPGSATGVRFIRLEASGQVQMFMIPVIPGAPAAQTIRATAFAGQAQLAGLGKHGDPFSPDAINLADPNFGFVAGEKYTLKWAPPGQRNKPGGMCPGEAAAGYDAGNGSDRGYLNLGQGNGNSALHDAIVNRDFEADRLDLGDVISVVPGNKHVGPALEARFSQDTNQSSYSYSDYMSQNTGNGRRLMFVAINNPADNTIIGFATFFLQPDSWGGNQEPVCAEYVGVSAQLESMHRPAQQMNNRVYTVKLMNGGF